MTAPIGQVPCGDHQELEHLFGASLMKMICYGLWQLSIGQVPGGDHQELEQLHGAHLMKMIAYVTGLWQLSIGQVPDDDHQEPEQLHCFRLMKMIAYVTRLWQLSIGQVLGGDHQEPEQLHDARVLPDLGQAQWGSHSLSVLQQPLHIRRHAGGWVAGLGIRSFQKNVTFLRSFPFFKKEWNVFCVIFRSL